MSSTDTATQVVHRIFYVGVGKASADRTKTIIDRLRKNINKATYENKNLPEDTFLDIYIPTQETYSRMEIIETHLTLSAFGKYAK